MYYLSWTTNHSLNKILQKDFNIKKPKLLLADEPVASLDPKAANLVMSLLKKINKEFNITVICNLHQVDLASKYSDRVVGLLDGEIMFDKTASNINKISIGEIYR